MGVLWELRPEYDDEWLDRIQPHPRDEVFEKIRAEYLEARLFLMDYHTDWGDMSEAESLQVAQKNERRRQVAGPLAKILTEQYGKRLSVEMNGGVKTLF